MQSASASVLIAAADSKLRAEVRSFFSTREFTLVDAHCIADIVPIILKCHPSLVLLASAWEGPEDGLSVARLIRSRRRLLPIILLVQQSSEALAIAALKAGVVDYFTRPWPWDDIRASVHRNLGLVRDHLSLHRTAPDPDCAMARSMIGESSAIRTMREYLGKVARTDCSVLITGETGTGKELAAQLIHAIGTRSQRPFVCINCAAIPDTLFESELFGYERGAFTGAHVRKEGQLELADKGTVFFDEIGDMSPYLQAKLLRAIETREMHRLGGKKAIQVDIRVIAATNRDLERWVAEDRFRKDLYFRINVARIHLPPLRERKEDIILLADCFRREMNERFHRDVEGFEEDAAQALLYYDWPGNIRELRNVMEATYIDLASRRISLGDLPEHVRSRLMTAQRVPESERERLLATLASTNWNMSKAAQKLHWSRMTLYRKTAKYHISRGGMREGPPSPGPQDPSLV